MLVVGLGNPGMKYALSRHNAGFWVIDELARRCKEKIKQQRCQSLCQEVMVAEKKVLLAKPLTFMNRSGLAVAGLASCYSKTSREILIVYDDLDLEVGRIKLSPRGGSGGHKGCSSIIYHLGTEDFPRLRIGIGRPPAGMPPPAYVLSRFSVEEEPYVAEAIERAADAAITWIKEGVDAAMNRFNVREPGKQKDL